MSMHAQEKSAEIKTLTYPDIKSRATEVYSRQGFTLNDAINVFLTKSIEVGGFPFSMKANALDYESLAKIAYKPVLNSEGVVVLPADWDDDE